MSFACGHAWRSAAFRSRDARAFSETTSRNHSKGHDNHLRPYPRIRGVPSRVLRCASTNGEKCESSDDCCGAPCGPSDPLDPKSAKICDPPKYQCTGFGKGCEFDSECCDFENGALCKRGKCACINDQAPDADNHCDPPMSCAPQGGACKTINDCCNAEALGLMCLSGVCAPAAPQ